MIEKIFLENTIIKIFSDFLLDPVEISRLVQEINNNIFLHLTSLYEKKEKQELLTQVKLTRQEIDNISKAISAGIVTDTTKRLLLVAEEKEKNLLTQLSLIEFRQIPHNYESINAFAFEKYFRGVSKQLSDAIVFCSVVDRITFDNLSESEVTIKIIEKIDHTKSYINELINQNQLGIRYELGPRFQPYSPRVLTFNVKLKPRAGAQRQQYEIIK